MSHCVDVHLTVSIHHAMYYVSYTEEDRLNSFFPPCHATKCLVFCFR